MLLYVLSTLLFTYIPMLLPWKNLRATIINPQNNLQMRGDRWDGLHARVNPCRATCVTETRAGTAETTCEEAST
jgi:hypothetical protein